MCRNFCWEFPLAPYYGSNPVLLQENQPWECFTLK